MTPSARLRTLAGSKPGVAQAGYVTVSAAELESITRQVERSVADFSAHLRGMKAERDAAIRECGMWAREAGEAKGRLEMSEAAGIVDGWRERAEAAEAALAELQREVVATPASLSIPAGWVLVPRIATQAMKEAASSWGYDCAHDVWNLMMAAALRIKAEPANG